MSVAAAAPAISKKKKNEKLFSFVLVTAIFSIKFKFDVF